MPCPRYRCENPEGAPSRYQVRRPPPASLPEVWGRETARVQILRGVWSLPEKTDPHCLAGRLKNRMRQGALSNPEDDELYRTTPSAMEPGRCRLGSNGT